MDTRKGPLADEKAGAPWRRLAIGLLVLALIALALYYLIAMPGMDHSGGSMANIAVVDATR